MSIWLETFETGIVRFLIVKYVCRSAHDFDSTSIENDDLRAETDCFGYVVGDVDEGNSGTCLGRGDFIKQARSRFDVDR